MSSRQERCLSPRIERLREATLARVHECHLDRAKLITESYKATEGQPIILRRARALSHFLTNVPLRIFDDELLVGDRSWVQPYRQQDRFPNWNYPDQSPKIKPEVRDGQWADEIGAIWEYWLDDNTPPPTLSTIKGHCVPGFHLLLTHGFEGIAEQADSHLRDLVPSDPRHEAKSSFLQAMIILAEACAAIGQRFADLASEMASGAHGGRRHELLQIARICERVPAKRPTNFREAVQAVWLGQLLIEAEDNPNAQSPGRLDQLLFPFYRRDIDSGRITRDQAKELLSCLWLKLWAPYDVHDVVIGGLTPDGRDATNELSELLLQVQRELGLRRQLSVRYHGGMDRRFLSEVCDCIRDGLGVPQIFNDDVLVPALVDSWLPIEEARNYSIIGCIEMTVPGRADPRAVAHYSNLPECLEWALNDGKCMMSGQQMGIRTGDPLTIRSFDELFQRYRLQAAYEVQQAVARQSERERRETETYPMPLLSLLTEGCIEKAKDITEGGARYNSTMFCAVGIPNVADSLAAMRKLVFEEGVVDLSDLLQALRDNFHGGEKLRQMLLTQAPKYGNDQDYVDMLALKVSQHYCQELSRWRDPRGGPFLPSFFSFTQCIWMGKMVGATPDGRLAGTPLANNLCAAQGNLKKGPTALLKSAAKLQQRQASGGTSLLLDLHPSMVRKTEGRDPLMSLIETYFSLGGTHVEVSLIDEKTLRTAQRHPHQYRDLTVRVAGYSAAFVDLNRDLQDHVIERTRIAR